MGLLFLILGLVWWVPIGLLILAAFIVSRAIGVGTVRSSPEASRPAVGTLPGAGGKAEWQIASAATAPEVGEIKHRVTIGHSMITAPRHCAVLKMSNANSRNSWSDRA